MKGKGFFRLIEWGKTLLILVLAASAIYLLGETQFSDGMLSRVQSMLSDAPADKQTDSAGQSDPAVVRPMRVVITLEGGQRYGVQYDLTGTDAAFSSVSTLLAEALSSAGAPRKTGESIWRANLSRMGIYLDFEYPLPLTVLSGHPDDQPGGADASAAVRRLCLVAGQEDGVELLYRNEADGAFYACTTTLSRRAHLEPTLAGWSANGAMFAFEVPGMEHVAPYLLLTSAPQPGAYRGSNPLTGENGRIAELLKELSFQTRGTTLDPLEGGLHVEGNDSLRLLSNGMLTFHTLGDSEFRFLLPENTRQGALDYTQELANATVGKWCDGAVLCLAGVQETADGLEILYRYCLDGIPVELPEGNAAARFLVRKGAVTDFSLYLRTYSPTGETTLILPERQAAAALGTGAGEENELVLIYQDGGGESVRAGWIAN